MPEKKIHDGENQDKMTKAMAVNVSSEDYVYSYSAHVPVVGWRCICMYIRISCSYDTVPIGQFYICMCIHT